ncbi:MAG: coproporphyrinogen III oxidase family protein [Actinobacteria bacterium]|nr:coproporphyrinogen III oxidase family protein [Actinomycetota bacterium]
MLTQIITRAIRRYLVGSRQEFIFKPIDDIKLPSIEKIDMYIHIPFCKNKCPYCPYNKIMYDKNLVRPYLEAILAEIEQYYNRLGRIKITSIYIGGGTPTNLIDELGVILGRIRDRFIITGNICIETTPSDLNEETVSKLVSYGVNLVSLGVQSFDDKYLQLIGRNYKASILYPVIELLLSSNFKSINIDLMFSLPGQTVKEVILDLKKAINSGVNQVTLYPLFTFPYSTVGKYLNLKRVKMPNIITRKSMYYAIHDFCIDNGFKRVSVWGFIRNDVYRYSSVTRDNYIGFGAGAGSHISKTFYLNTFSIKEYIKTCFNEKLPVALKMDFTDSMTRYYWLYWRFYDTYIPKGQLFELFGKNDKNIQLLLWLINILKLGKEDAENIFLSKRGAFWLHLIQNYFVLNYINKIWSVAMKKPWPNEIRI